MRFHELMESTDRGAWISRMASLRLSVQVRDPNEAQETLSKIQDAIPGIEKHPEFQKVISMVQQLDPTDRSNHASMEKLTQAIRFAVQSWFFERMESNGLMEIPDRSINSQRFTPIIKKYLGHSSAFSMAWHIKDLQVFNSYLDQYEKFKGEGKLGQPMNNEVMEIAKTIAANCEKFCRESDLIPLYRGAKSHDHEHFVKKTIHKDRFSASDMYGVYDNINQRMKNAGFTAIRTNGLNTTGSAGQATGYGTVGVVFMIGDYHFTWSPKVQDYLTTLENINETYVREHGGPENSDDMESEDLAQVFWDDFGETYQDETNSSLKQAIKSENEILLTNHDGYYVLDRELFVEVAQHVAMILNL